MVVEIAIPEFAAFHSTSWPSRYDTVFLPFIGLQRGGSFHVNSSIKEVVSLFSLVAFLLAIHQTSLVLSAL